MPPIKIMAIEPEFFYRKGIVCFLRDQAGVEVLEGEGLENSDILETTQYNPPDLLILGCSPSETHYLDLIKRLKQARPETKVLFLVEKTSGMGEMCVLAFKEGADGFLIKGIKPSQLLKCIQLLSQGEIVVHRALIPWLVQELHSRARQPVLLPEPGPDRLTAREEDILKCLAEGKANKEIAQSLHIAEYTVRNHFKKILKKLHLENRIQAALYAQRMGISNPFQYEKGRQGDWRAD